MNEDQRQEAPEVPREVLSQYSIYKLIAKYDNVILSYDTVCASPFYKFRGESFALPQSGTFPQDFTIVKTEGDWEYHCQLRIMP